MRRPWLLMLLGWLVVGAGVFAWKMMSRPESDNRASLAPVIAAIEGLGGRVGFDDDDPERLAAVDFTATRVTDADLECLQNLTELRRLYLGGTQVSGAGLGHLSRLTGLEELYLLSTPVDDAGLRHLEGLTGLRELDLSATRVTNAGLKHLKTLTNLQHLYLADTRVTREGVKDLQRALPALTIYLDPVF